MKRYFKLEFATMAHKIRSEPWLISL